MCGIREKWRILMKTQNIGYKQYFGSVYFPKNKKTTQWIADRNKFLEYEDISPVDKNLTPLDIVRPHGSARIFLFRNNFTVQEIKNQYKIVGRNFDSERDFLVGYEESFHDGRIVPDHPSMGVYEALSTKRVSVDDIKHAVRTKRLDAGEVKQALLDGIKSDYMIFLKKTAKVRGTRLVKQAELFKALKEVVII